MKISNMEEAHWPGVKRIYQEGIDTGHATFELLPPETWRAWSEKFPQQLSLVCLEGDKVIGWAAISKVSSRKVYEGVGELSLYVGSGFQGQGVGDFLMEHILARSKKEGFWTLQAGIFPENLASLQLHQKHGFREVGRRKRIGKMTYGPLAGKWRDVLLLERRREDDLG